jgi:hypothetical protein
VRDDAALSTLGMAEAIRASDAAEREFRKALGVPSYKGTGFVRHLLILLGSLAVGLFTAVFSMLIVFIAVNMLLHLKL